MWWLYRVLVAFLLFEVLSSFRLNLPSFVSKRAVLSIGCTGASVWDESSASNAPPTNKAFFPAVVGNTAAATGANDEKKVLEKFLLLYTCKVCDFRNSNMVSKVGFYNGMVVSTCKGCQSMHLIADNERKLDFGDDGFARVDKYLASKGETVREISSSLSELRDNFLVEKDGVLTMVPKSQGQPLDGTVVQLPKALQDQLS